MAGYGSNSGFVTYVNESGLVLPEGATEFQITGARQRGSLVIDRYEPRFPGSRTGGAAQERAWPRAGAYTYSGEAVASDAVPAAIVNASYEAALLELTNPGSLSPVIIGNAAIKREKVGPLETEYAASSSTSQADIIAMATPVVTTIEGLLWPFFYQPLPAIAVV